MGSKEDADNRLRLWELAEGDPGADGDYALGEFACPGRREAKAGFWYVTATLKACNMRSRAETPEWPTTLTVRQVAGQLGSQVPKTGRRWVNTAEAKAAAVSRVQGRRQAGTRCDRPLRSDQVRPYVAVGSCADVSKRMCRNAEVQRVGGVLTATRCTHVSNCSSSLGALSASEVAACGESALLASAAHEAGQCVGCYAAENGKMGLLRNYKEAIFVDAVCNRLADDKVLPDGSGVHRDHTWRGIRLKARWGGKTVRDDLVLRTWAVSKDGVVTKQRITIAVDVVESCQVGSHRLLICYSHFTRCSNSNSHGVQTTNPARLTQRD
jgi:hypothetical protein